jgi:hypothetical protein
LHRSTGASWLANLGREPATLELEPAGQVTFPHGATPAQKTTLSSVIHELAASEREPDGQVQQFPLMTSCSHGATPAQESTQSLIDRASSLSITAGVNAELVPAGNEQCGHGTAWSDLLVPRRNGANQR